MPFGYDIQRSATTNGSANTESTHLWAKTAANQETVSILGIYCGARGSTAGGGQIRVKDNTGSTASGGTAQTPLAKNRRGNPAAQSVWANDATAITPGGTLLVRLAVGFAQTGGMGGYVPITPQMAIQMMPNATNPVDVEFLSICSSTGVPIDLTVEIGEGV